MSAAGYQVSVTLHKDMRYGIITRMPDAKSKTLPAADLDTFLADMATDPRPETLERWFDKTGAPA